jgi:hypothetical protein
LTNNYTHFVEDVVSFSTFPANLLNTDLNFGL